MVNIDGAPKQSITMMHPKISPSLSRCSSLPKLLVLLIHHLTWLPRAHIHHSHPLKRNNHNPYHQCHRLRPQTPKPNLLRCNSSRISGNRWLRRTDGAPAWGVRDRDVVEALGAEELHQAMGQAERDAWRGVAQWQGEHRRWWWRSAVGENLRRQFEASEVAPPLTRCSLFSSIDGFVYCYFFSSGDWFCCSRIIIKIGLSKFSIFSSMAAIVKEPVDGVWTVTKREGSEMESGGG